MLPDRVVFVKLRDCGGVAGAISSMMIRGAPLIGAAAGYGLALAAFHSRASSRRELLRELDVCAGVLRGTRPTGVNLFWAVDRILSKVRASSGASVGSLKALVLREAETIADEDVEINRRIGEYGSRLVRDGDSILTHCNAGALATVDYGTALGVVRACWEQGKKIKVIATETRPRLQGARLTAYELKSIGVPFCLITDGMVGYVMSKGLVSKVVVGADRVVRDGVANKIGTYSVAVLAHEHKVPFYVAAPLSTFDLEHGVGDVVIEERSVDEVTCYAGSRVAPEGTVALNPAFDVTPMRYVTGVICEKGVFSPKKIGELAKVGVR
jgi:methylthioribose-1-phosphate isomerase